LAGPHQRRQQKIFQGGRGEATKRIPKSSKKIPKIALFSLFQEGGNGKKDRKIAKKAKK